VKKQREAEKDADESAEVMGGASSSGPKDVEGAGGQDPEV
jgi:hypothetical protein